MHWFAQVQGQIYGPYSDADMQGYVGEGRVNGQSLISNNPAEGFYAASGYDIFAFWAGTGQLMQAQPAAPNHTAYTANPVHSIQPVQSPHVSAQTQPSAFTGASPQQPAVQAAQTAQAPQHSPNPEAAKSVFTIMAEIRSEGMMDFLTQLQNFGTAERVGDSVWLLKSSASADALRNNLSQALSRQDRMFIVDCTHNKTAWFNIGADLDNRIRNIWED